MLSEILKVKREEIKERKSQFSLSDLEKRFQSFSPRSLKNRLKAKGLTVIAEIKKASPSKGVIREDFSLPLLVSELKDAGADALSILTEEKFFKGKLDYLSQARKISMLPILRKDFIFDPYQLYEARAYGADAVLLIVGILNSKQLKGLVSLSHELGLEVLVEASNREEIELALEAGAEIVGINNRNLRTFEVNLERSLSLISFLPQEVCRVAESGVRGGEEAKKLKEAGFDSILVGESLMRADDLKSKIKELKNF